jgi:hypothetical protein
MRFARAPAQAGVCASSWLQIRTCSEALAQRVEPVCREPLEGLDLRWAGTSSSGRR